MKAAEPQSPPQPRLKHLGFIPAPHAQLPRAHLCDKDLEFSSCVRM